MNMEQALRSAENRIWLREKLNASGMIVPLTVLAARIVAGEPRPPVGWAYEYCLAYRNLA